MPGKPGKRRRIARRALSGKALPVFHWPFRNLHYFDRQRRRRHRLAALAHFVDDRFELPDCFKHHEPLLQSLARAQNPAIPVGHLPEKQTSHVLVPMLDQKLIMPAHEPQSIGPGRGGQLFSRPIEMLHLVKNPGIEQSAAADRDARAPGFTKHPLDIVTSVNVAIADDGDGAHRLDDRPDSRQADRAAKTLLARASMDSDRRNASILEDSREIRALRFFSSQPRRIFTVTGMRTACTTASTRRIAWPGSHIRAAPPPPRVTLWTGQPMLMSITDTP